MTSFWKWLVYAVLGLIILSILPDNIAMYLVVILILGGILFFEANGGVQGFVNTLEGQT